MRAIKISAGAILFALIAYTVAVAAPFRTPNFVPDETLRYKVTTGKLAIKRDTGELAGEIFFIAYTLKDTGDASSRPLTFSFNGGPGSASVWLHLGMLGPRRVEMLDDGSMYLLSLLK